MIDGEEVLQDYLRDFISLEVARSYIENLLCNHHNSLVAKSKSDEIAEECIA